MDINIQQTPNNSPRYPNQQPPKQEMPPMPMIEKPKKKNYLVIILIVLFLGASLFTTAFAVKTFFFPSFDMFGIFQPPANNLPQNTMPLPETKKATPDEDSLDSINSQLKDINISDLDTQFKEIDSDLNSL